MLQKYIKTGAEHSRSFIEKRLFLNPDLLPEIDELSEKKEKNILLRILLGIKVPELGSLLKNNFLDRNIPK